MRSSKFASGGWNPGTTEADFAAGISISIASSSARRPESVSTPYWNKLCRRPWRPDCRFCHRLQRRAGCGKADQEPASSPPLLSTAHPATRPTGSGPALPGAWHRPTVAARHAGTCPGHARPRWLRWHSRGCQTGCDHFLFVPGLFPIDLVSGALGDRPEPVAMFLPIGQVAAAVSGGPGRD